MGTSEGQLRLSSMEKSKRSKAEMVSTMCRGEKVYVLGKDY